VFDSRREKGLLPYTSRTVDTYTHIHTCIHFKQDAPPPTGQDGDSPKSEDEKSHKKRVEPLAPFNRVEVD